MVSSGFLAAVLTFVLLLAAGVVLAELTRRHHRTVARHGWRYGKRGGGTPSGGRGSSPGRGRQVTSVAHADHGGATRRAARGAPAAGAGRPSRGMTHLPGCGWAIPADGTCPPARPASRAAGSGTGPTYSWGPADSPSGWPTDDPETAHRWAQHMSTERQAAGGHRVPARRRSRRTVATYVNGKTSTEGASSMTASPSRIKTEHRARRAAARSGGSVPSAWGPVVAQTADFEPEDDGDLLELDARRSHRAERLRRGPGRPVRDLPRTRSGSTRRPRPCSMTSPTRHGEGRRDDGRRRQEVHRALRTAHASSRATAAC